MENDYIHFTVDSTSNDATDCSSTSIDWGAWPSAGTTITKFMYGGAEYVNKEENMRGLYRIIVVNPKTEDIGQPILVIAQNETNATVKAALRGVIRGKVEDYDILVDRLGDVRAKVVKEEA